MSSLAKTCMETRLNNALLRGVRRNRSCPTIDVLFDGVGDKMN